MGALTIRRGREAALVEEVHEDVLQYLTFQLSGETYAIGILSIKEILEYTTLTQVPLMPAFIRGVMNLRGAVVPVIDLAVRFWRKRTEVLRRSCIVIVEVDLDGARHDLGIVVDAVCEVVDIPAAEVEPAPTFGLKVRADFIHGMGKTENGFVVLLDVNHVLSIDELADLIGETSRRDTPQPA